MTQRVYRVEYVRQAERELAELPRRDQARVAEKINALARNPRPRGVKKLAGAESLYRLRVGEYRVVYEIRDRVLLILVVRVAHRREVYRK